MSDGGQVIGLQAGKSVLNGSISVGQTKNQIASVESQSNIVVLSGNFMSVTEKSLTLKSQYFLATKLSPSDVVIDATTGGLWIAIGSEIYSVTL
jgi:hypothetical protein